MGLSSNMWTSVSGLLMHGEKMGVIGNNIANISTIGFKSQRMDFEDFLYNNSFSASGPTQMGMGVGVSTIRSDFSQGGRESTGSTTDLMISGSGFFQVKDPYSEQVKYTRSGNFNFTNDGVLRSPSNFAVQGWAIPLSDAPSVNISGKAQGDELPSAMKGSGPLQDIRFTSTTLEPKKTSYMEMTVQLKHIANNYSDDKTTDPANPAFSLFNVWDGSQPANPANKPPIAEGSYMYPSTMKIYDEGGSARTVTTYYDQIDPKDFTNLPAGWSAYEYMVTMNPAEDMRTYGGKYNPATGTLVDDYSKLADPEKMSAAKAGISGTGLPTFSGGTAVNLENILAALNKEITRINDLNKEGDAGATEPFAPNPAISKATAETLGVVKYPGDNAWHVDPDDPVLVQVLGFTADAVAADVTILTNASEATNVPGPPADLVAGYNKLTEPEGYANANIVQRMAATASAGVLMIGTMFFDAGGNLVNQSAYTYQGKQQFSDNEVPSDNPNNLESWEPAPVSSSGYPVFTPNFSGHPLANAPHQNAADTNPIDKKDAATYLIEFNLGLKSNIINSPWADGAGASAADVGRNYSNMATFKNSEKSGMSPSTAYGSSNSSYGPVQNGYSFGYLSQNYFDQGGVLHGVYSNGQIVPLYQLALFDFTNSQGLRRDGGNEYSATADSGQPKVGAAGQNGLGTITGSSLEQSNVDLSIQFVQMISTQRGYQSNSKSITTTDSMLETVINIVR